MTKPKPKTHPLIGALIAELEQPGRGAFPLERRMVWLRMAAMAFDLVYGVEAAIAVCTDPPLMHFEPAGFDGIDRRPGAITCVDGDGAPTRAKEVHVGPAPKLLGARAPDQRYLIDLEGKAWGPAGRIDPAGIAAGEFLWDFRPGEQPLDTVQWKSGGIGVHDLSSLSVLKG
jgi:hypothetical protein